ncbi:ankyrin repeat domain-containing protein [Moraxella nasovis]|uniref:ankyrin repeat domain-containing protein n=1 Tax=Moraxella nasovis TaxID=2904121 RepID=UPI001F61060F|nr:ankyrin repeat domain-containing protein [Moraxella nasovis]UNU73346.1 ankyrin repeat domain-containing protein [Moraxella nasovis]
MSGVEILEALHEGDFKKLEYLLKKYPHRTLLDISKEMKRNWLHKVADSMNANEPPLITINYLIDLGIDINAQDIYGMTPLHYAMRSRNAEVAITLLEAGADPNIPNINDLRPLSMVGYTKDRLDVLELMLKKGGNVFNIINGNETILESWLPSDYAEQWEKDIYEIMKQYS